LHCVLHQNALILVVNRPRTGANCGLMNVYTSYLRLQANPFLHQNQPSRESIFCGKVSGWWVKWALIMLKFIQKSGQKEG